ncbi:flagellar motor protein [Halobacteroides halobius DSM 5150]|uniref:Flagellar motor protein n=1 Tax=Halobacteroides halobius (strain ATCC 35273 / DSM 5150 / MD-1) TaxID=748449 RepID=L0K5S6_HALHC|nr:flagellar motor protein MotB [Halobacteroides halobius]AGB40637.1 flagellar motor protein [Halobacteroides halobius DSM 5150]
MPRDKDDNGADWMTTYADMVTLLLAFFVLLYSFSSINAQKFKMMIEGLQGKLGVLEGGKTISESKMINAGLNSPRISNELSNLYRQVSKYIKENNLEKDINLKVDERGLTIRFTGQVLFELGEAKIKSGSKDTLSQIAAFIKSVPNDVVIEGHTDSLPISNSDFASNWELSTTRATNVIKYFIEQNSITPSRLAAAGYSKYKPIRPNNSPRNRAMNRRVDVVILRMEEDKKKEEVINE